MPVGGEINQHIQGNRARVIEQFSSLSLIGNVPSTSTTTGTLKVTGGTGITGNLFVGGTVTSQATNCFATSALDGAYSSWTNTPGVRSSYIGVSGTNYFSSLGVSASLVLSTTTAFGVGTPIYLAPGGGTNSSSFGLKVQSGSVVNTSNNTLDDGTSAISLSNSGSSTSQIGKGTYTGTLQLGGNGIDITANSTGLISIGNGLNSVYIGSQSGANSVVNIQVGAGSNVTNICSSGYTGTVTFGNSSCPINIASSGLTITAPTNINTSGSSTVNIGNASSTLNILGTTNINTSGGSGINIGTGTATGQITIGSGSNNNSVNINSNGNTIAAFSTNSNSPQIEILSGNILRCYLGYNTVNGVLLTNGNNANILYQSSGGFNDLSLRTANNILDDGTGNITMVGTSDPIFSLRRSSYSTNFISRFRFVDNNTSGKYWEIGTDVGGSKGGDLYFYGQGAGGLGLALQLTAKGYLYLGYGAPFFQTTVTTPSTGNQTITAAHLLGNIVIAPITSSAFTWTTDTGTNIYTAMGSPATGTTFQVLFSNANNSAGAVMTIAFGTGVTGNLRGNTLNNNSSMLIYFRCTGTNTFTCYS